VRNADRMMASASVTANSRNRRPMSPPMKRSGMSTAHRLAVSDTMVKPICLAPASAAWNGCLPSSM
jgi:hypothetical protein